MGSERGSGWGGNGPSCSHISGKGSAIARVVLSMYVSGRLGSYPPGRFAGPVRPGVVGGDIDAAAPPAAPNIPRAIAAAPKKRGVDPRLPNPGIPEVGNSPPLPVKVNW